MLATVEINHVQHISFTQSRLTDAVSVILSELLSYEHPPNAAGRSLFSLVLEELYGRVDGVHDADNVVFEDKEHVRVLGIDALGLAEHGQDVLPRLVYVGLELLAGEGAGLVSVASRLWSSML